MHHRKLACFHVLWPSRPRCRHEKLIMIKYLSWTFAFEEASLVVDPARLAAIMPTGTK